MFKLIMVLLISFTFVLSSQADTHDTDNDLVPNTLDKCPNTPEGVFVNRDGCTKSIKRIVYFDHASSEISLKYKISLLQIAQLISETPGYNIFISGHTDSVADAKVNITLSKNRAMVVRNILVNNKVDKNKIMTTWYGETMPVSSNITKEGRRENRRVNIILK
jgi:OOP family OmpA-OmpF porin